MLVFLTEAAHEKRTTLSAFLREVTVGDNRLNN